jgi:hypothetical protein
VGFEVLPAIVLKIWIFWDITPYGSLKGDRHFGGTLRLHFHGRRISQDKLFATFFHAGLLLGFFFYPEDGYVFLRNVG